MKPKTLDKEGLQRIFKKTESSIYLQKLLDEAASKKTNIEEVADHLWEAVDADTPTEWAYLYRAAFMPILKEAATHREFFETMYKAFRTIGNLALERHIAPSKRTEAQAVILSNAPATLINWTASGQKEYKVSKGLEEKLRATNLKNYPAENFNLPFEAIYLHVEFFENLQGVLIGQRDGNLNILSFNDQETYSEMRIELTEGKALDKCIENFDYDSKKTKERWKELFSFIINTVLYATMQDAEQQFQYYDKSYEKLQKRLEKTKNPKKKNHIRKQMLRTNKEGYTYLGGSIKVDRTQDPESATRTQNHSGRTVNVRFLVSGHWRNQPTNEGPKRIWIKPFWKGPEYAPLTGRPHHLK